MPQHFKGLQNFINSHNFCQRYFYSPIFPINPCTFTEVYLYIICGPLLFQCSSFTKSDDGCTIALQFNNPMAFALKRCTLVGIPNSRDKNGFKNTTDATCPSMNAITFECSETTYHSKFHISISTYINSNLDFTLKCRTSHLNNPSTH